MLAGMRSDLSSLRGSMHTRCLEVTLVQQQLIRSPTTTSVD